MRRVGLPRGPASVPAPLDIALWVASDNGPLLCGYTAAQLTAPTYSAAPAFTLQLTGVSAHIRGACVLRDGPIVFGLAETKTWYTLPRRKLVGPRLVDSASSPSALLPAPGDATAFAVRPVQMPNSDVVFVSENNGGSEVRLRRTKVGAPNGPQALITVADGGVCFDTQADAAGNLWLVEYSTDTLRRLSAASIAGAGSATVDKIATGTNFADCFGMAIDATGGIWTASYDGAELRYHDATAIGALNGTPSNPAATRTLTSAAFGGPNGIALDRVGGAWVALYDAEQVVYFTAAQLAAGGAQTPGKVISLPVPAGGFGPGGIAFGLGYGLGNR